MLYYGGKCFEQIIIGMWYRLFISPFKYDQSKTCDHNII